MLQINHRLDLLALITTKILGIFSLPVKLIRNTYLVPILNKYTFISNCTL